MILILKKNLPLNKESNLCSNMMQWSYSTEAFLFEKDLNIFSVFFFSYLSQIKLRIFSTKNPSNFFS